MDDDDDIIVPNDNRVSLKCPLTSSTFVDPVKNKVSSYAMLDEVKNIVRYCA